MTGRDRDEWHGGDPGWRRAQRKRQNQLSRRGEATLVAGFAVVSLLIVGLLFGVGSDEESSTAPSGPADVGAAPAELPPPSIFERLPVSDAVLELPVRAGSSGERFYEVVPMPEIPAVMRVDYTLDTEMTRQVFKTLDRARVALGHVIVLDPATGRVIAYASTDTQRFPPTRAYPAASLVKVITAAAALDRDPGLADLKCRYRGSPYRLTRTRIDPPSSGNEISLQKALASSNNQCFAQLAVHAVGGESMMSAISRFGWLAPPAPAHDAGYADPVSDRYDLGLLGCGLAGSHITPLHAAQLAAALARGELVSPHWIEGVYDSDGRELAMPPVAVPRQVMTRELAAELRQMLVDTTVRGTARRAFRKRNGRPKLGSIRVAGKTGSLSGTDPTGRYEWFAGVAPADDPQVAVAVLLVQGHLWWRNASQIAAEVLTKVFCSGSSCRPELASRWLRTDSTASVAREANAVVN